MFGLVGDEKMSFGFHTPEPNQTTSALGHRGYRVPRELCVPTLLRALCNLCGLKRCG